MSKAILAFAAVMALSLRSVTAQGPTSQEPRQRLSEILGTPALAPAVRDILANQTLLAGAINSSLFNTLDDNLTTVVEIVQGPVIQEIFGNSATRQEIIQNPGLTAFANPANVPAAIEELVSASETPTSGNAEQDLRTVLRELGLPPSGRKMLRA